MHLLSLLEQILGASSQGTLCKLYFFLSFFFFFWSLKAFICVRAAHGGGEPLFTDYQAKEPAFEIGKRERAGRDPEWRRDRAACPQRQWGPGPPPRHPCTTSGTSRHKRYRMPQRRRLKKPPVWTTPCSSEPCLPFQLNIEAFCISTQLRLVTAPQCFNLSRGQRITHFLGRLFRCLSANDWGQWRWWRQWGWRVWSWLSLNLLHTSHRPIQCICLSWIFNLH